MEFKNKIILYASREGNVGRVSLQEFDIRYIMF